MLLTIAIVVKVWIILVSVDESEDEDELGTTLSLVNEEYGAGLGAAIRSRSFGSGMLGDVTRSLLPQPLIARIPNKTANTNKAHKMI